MERVIMNREKTEVKNAEERNYAVDLLRIIAMLMIIFLHILRPTWDHAVIKNTQVLSVNYMAANFMEIASYGAVNIYALISGYVCLNSRFKPYKIVSLWIEVIFYDILFTALGLLLKPETTDLHSFIDGLKLWYVVSYFGMFFFIPFFNHIINTLSRSNLKKLIMIIMSFSVITTFLRYDFLCLNGGYCTLWLSFLYIIGGYMKKYKSESSVQKRYLAGYFICIIICFISFAAISILTYKIFGGIRGNYFFVSYVSPFVLLSSIFLLKFFSGMKINNRILIRIIKLTAPSTFGVYVIHQHPLLNDNIVSRFGILGSYPVFGMILSITAVALVIYIMCTLIDILRIQLFKILRIENLSRKITALFGKFFDFCLGKGEDID